MEHRRFVETIYLFGGGFDSTATAILEANRHRKAPVHLLHIDYGQKACGSERKVLYALESRYANIHAHTVSCDFFAYNNENPLLLGQPKFQQVEPYIMEGRNFYFAVIASRYASRVAFSFPASHGGPEEPKDTTDEWAANLSCVLTRYLDRQMDVFTACGGMERDDYAALAWQQDSELLMSAHTCYESQECGDCVRCTWKTLFVYEMATTYGTGYTPRRSRKIPLPRTVGS